MSPYSLPTPNFGGWHDYQLWAEHDFQPRGPDDDEDDPVPEDAEQAEAEPDQGDPDEPETDEDVDWPSRHDARHYLDAPLSDEDTSMLVRPYTRTGGRTQSCRELAMETLVSVTDVGRCDDLTGDHRQISRLCTQPVSISEIAAGLRLPINVVQVLIGDMAEDDLVFIHRGEPLIGDRPSVELMRRVLDGLHAL